MTNLDPNDNKIKLEIYYEITDSTIEKIKELVDEKHITDPDDLKTFLQQHISQLLGPINRKSVCTKGTDYYIDLNSGGMKLENFVAFKFISAKRGVSNIESNKTLSNQVKRLYEQINKEDPEEPHIEKFKEALRQTDKIFTETYKPLFQEIVESVKKFGGVHRDDTKISIVSTLEHQNILSSNATVMYEHDSHSLPESYNGLGYMNLISIIFDLDILVKELGSLNNENGAPINLLFIEEPEVHTHPQLQYIFIKNIREHLKELKNSLTSLQTIMSTHSAHIVSEAEFEKIIYLKRDHLNVEAKSLQKLEESYSKSGSQQAYKFLKQYLTLHRSEIFFADKLILIEGDTERILLPAMMQKIDIEEPRTDILPLLSQNISIITAGSYSHIYANLIEFLGLKTLIITDFDTSKEILEDGKIKETPCPPDDKEVKFTRNSSLKFFHRHNLKEKEVEYFVKLTSEEKVCAKLENGKWGKSKDGYVYTAFQTKENKIHGRTFEDSFFSINRTLLETLCEDSSTLTKKHCKSYLNNKMDLLDFTSKAIKSKPSLAIEILLASEQDPEGTNPFSNWETPSYIRDGLIWLKEN